MSKSFKASKLIGVTGAALGAFGGVSYLTFREVMHRNAKLPPVISALAMKAMDKDAPAAPAEPDERAVWFEQQHFEEYTIENDRGFKLKGYLLPAQKPSDVFVFGSHGYRNHAKGEFNYMAKFYHDKGYNVFLVDHQAAGESEGTYIGFGYYEYKDCLKWLGFMLETFGKDIQIILHGVSMGSATVMLMSSDPSLPENVKFTVADCGYTSAWNEFKSVLKGAHVPAFPLLEGADFFNKKIGGYRFKDADALESVANAKLPMLFIHGSTDTFVPTYMATQLYHACSSEYKDLLIVEGAWHAESYRKDSAAYEGKICEFADKFIKVKQEAKK
ncbi:MAG: alpha/beta hydrolase [Clostridiales bacterium]|nr:alpha/beta hydrolase [Clostridiales bacterium]